MVLHSCHVWSSTNSNIPLNQSSVYIDHIKLSGTHADPKVKVKRLTLKLQVTSRSTILTYVNRFNKCIREWLFPIWAETKWLRFHWWVNHLVNACSNFTGPRVHHHWCRGGKHPVEVAVSIGEFHSVSLYFPAEFFNFVVIVL